MTDARMSDELNEFMFSIKLECLLAAVLVEKK